MAYGRTVVEIIHPDDNVRLDNLDNRMQTLAQLENAMRALNNGALGEPTTEVFVSQGGVQSYGTITLSGVGGTAATGSYALSNVGGTKAEGTLTFSSASGSGTAVVNGVSFPWTFDTDDETTAVALAADITASVNPLVAGVLTAGQTSAGQIEVIAVHKGTAGNAITLAVTGTGLTRSGATLTLGAQGAVTVGINGTSVGPVDTTDLTDTAAATAVAAAVEANGTLGPLLAAVGSTTNVSITWGAKGTAGNAITLAVGVSATGTATRSGATLSGGAQGSVTTTVNGTAEVTDTTNLTDTQAAALVAAEVTANTTIDNVAHATSAADVVTVTANEYGPVGDLITLTASTSTGSATTGHLSGGKLTGGTAATGQFLVRP